MYNIQKVLERPLHWVKGCGLWHDERCDAVTDSQYLDSRFSVVSPSKAFDFQDRLCCQVEKKLLTFSKDMSIIS